MVGSCASGTQASNVQDMKPGQVRREGWQNTQSACILTFPFLLEHLSFSIPVFTNLFIIYIHGYDVWIWLVLLLREKCWKEYSDLWKLSSLSIKNIFTSMVSILINSQNSIKFNNHNGGGKPSHICHIALLKCHICHNSTITFAKILELKLCCQVSEEEQWNHYNEFVFLRKSDSPCKCAAVTKTITNNTSMEYFWIHISN